MSSSRNNKTPAGAKRTGLDDGPKLPGQRARRSNTELLKVPRVAMQRIREVAQQSKMPIDQVFSDVLENGLLTIGEMYSGIIEFRKAREQRWNEQNAKPDKSETPPDESIEYPRPGSASEDTGNGSTVDGPLADSGESVAGQTLSHLAGFDDATLERGLEAPSDESFGVVSERDEEPTIQLHE
jgi:hypothetical protein